MPKSCWKNIIPLRKLGGKAYIDIDIDIHGYKVPSKYTKKILGVP
jgi:hypothetical protein